MPDFYVVVTGSPSLSNRVWEDPPSVTRPSRITAKNELQHRRLVAQVDTILTLTAIRNGETSPELDSAMGKFIAKAIEYPTGIPIPFPTIVIPGRSSVQQFLLEGFGHYTLAIRHEDTQDAPYAAAGGTVFVHVDVEGEDPQ